MYVARKYTVEPVIGIIKEVMGFPQFSLRGEQGAADKQPRWAAPTVNKADDRTA